MRRKLWGVRRKGFTLIELAVTICMVVGFVAVMIICGILIYNCGRGHDCEDHTHGANGEVIDGR